MRVITMLTGRQLGRHAELRRAEHPVWICEVIEKAKVLEAPVGGVKAIPFRLFDVHAHVSLRVCAPARRAHQKRLEQRAFALARSEQERAVEESWTSFVVEIALVLVEISVHTKTAVAKLNAADGRVVSGFFAWFRRRVSGISLRRRR